MAARVPRKASITERRVCLLILGMHRSGTSALAKALDILGADLPHNLMGSNHGNDLGHWESSVLSAFDDEILSSAGSSWDDWLAFNPDWYKSLIYDRFVQRGRQLLTDEFGDSPLFVFKDPRNCRIAPFWLDVLEREGIEPGIIIPVRHFHEVANSLNLRDDSKLEYGALMWLRHVLDAEAATRGRRRAFVTFDQLLSDWQAVVGSIETGLDITFPRKSAKVSVEISEFLDGRHRHFSTAGSGYDSGIGRWLDQVFQLLANWSVQGENPADHAQLDAIAEAFDKSSVAFAPIIMQAAMAGEAGEGERRRLDLEDRIAQLESALTEAAAKAEEIEALRDALVRNERALSQYAHDWEKVQAERVDLERQLAESTERTSGFAAQSDALHHSQNVLRQREEEIEQTRAELVAAKRQLAELETVLVAQSAELERKDAQLGQLNEELIERLKERDDEAAALREALEAAVAGTVDAEVRIAELTATHDQTQRALAASDEQSRRLSADLGAMSSQVAQLRSHVESTEAKVRTAEGQLASERTAREETQRNLDKQNYELGALNLNLRRQEAEFSALTDQAEWLREFNAAIHSEPRWWALLPATNRTARRHRRLFDRGLFDAEAYLQRYPDVAGEGVDPLTHYILHGMEEGRHSGF